MSKKPPVTPDYRSAVDGRFVSEDYAKKHPRTTVREINPPPKPSGGGKKR